MMKKRWFLLFIILGGLYVFFGNQRPKKELVSDLNDSLKKQVQIQKQMEKMKKERKDEKMEVKALEKEIKEYKDVLNKKTQSYVKQKFVKDGKTYYSEEEFFSDIKCSKKIEQEIKIVSPVVDELKKGLDTDEVVYAVLTNLGLAYCKEQPYITTEKPLKEETTEEVQDETEESTEESSLY